MPALIEMADRRFGNWIVLSRAKNDSGGKARWDCRCECGTIRAVVGTTLRAGISKSCGCLNRLPPGEAAFNSLVQAQQLSARKRGYSWELTNTQFRELTRGDCFYCGEPPRQIRGNPKFTTYNGAYTYNGLDRLDANRGYMPENVVSCCGTCNFAKGSMTPEKFRDWIVKVYEHLAGSDYILAILRRRKEDQGDD